MQSIQVYGWTTPILVTDGLEVIAGHGRLLAAQKLGIELVPCIRLKHLTPALVKAYRIADNRLTLDSDWDDELLASVMADLHTDQDFDLALTGFDPEEIGDFLGFSDPQAGEDDTPAIQEIAVSRLGDVWEMDGHRLICGDCTDGVVVSAVLNGVKPLVLVSDPPYGVRYDPSWREDLPFGVKRDQYMNRQGDEIKGDEIADWSEAFKIVSADVIYIWHAPGALSMKVMAGIERIGYQIRATLIWVKEHAALSQGHYSYQHEPCCYAVLKGKIANWHGNAYESSVMHINMVKAHSGEDFVSDHGCQKPIECMRRPIVNHTVPSDAVYDPFMGSGTTLIAAESTHRVAYGCEIEPLYVDMAVRRWQMFTGHAVRLSGDGRTFEEIQDARGSQT